MSHASTRTAERTDGLQVSRGLADAGGDAIQAKEASAIEWQAQWPERPNDDRRHYYWFYGRRSRSSRQDELLIVEVWPTGRGAHAGCVYVSRGSFLYKDDGAKGVWMRIEPPCLPARIDAIDDALREQETSDGG